MANRVTSAEVLAILTSTSFSDIDAFITAANLTVTDRLGDDENLSDDQLKEIERWLAAHFVCVADPRLKSEGTDGATAAYEKGNLGKSLEFTSYGQQVLLLDTSGKMSMTGKKQAALDAIDFFDV
jgi:hypothetical protein